VKGIEQHLLRAALQRSKTPIKLQIPLAPTALQVPFGTRYMGSSPGRHKKGQKLDLAPIRRGRVTPYARRKFRLAWQALRFELHLVFVYRLTCLRSNVTCISTSTSPRTSNPNIPRNHPPRPAAYKRRAIRHGVCKFQQRKARQRGRRFGVYARRELFQEPARISPAHRYDATVDPEKRWTASSSCYTRVHLKD
jgi:hypothetical protein